jgi:hypothetical protein
MKGDFSRLTFQAQKQFSRVLLQQGRVLLDADFNEQGAIFAYGLRQLARNLLGPHAGPAIGSGFAIAPSNGRITIAPGRYYVDGLLVVNDRPLDANGAVVPLFYDAQLGYPFDPQDPNPFRLDKPYFFYLVVWEQPITYFDDDSIREVSLGGPDTAMRAQIAWQVRAVASPGTAGNFDFEAWLDQHLRRHDWHEAGPADARLPQMMASTDPTGVETELTSASPLGGYSGLENQHYRVEIHTALAEAGGVTFKWSRENGSVVAAWLRLDGNDLVVDGLHDTQHGFSPNQWVELTDAILRHNVQPGVMVRLLSVDRNRLTIDPATASGPIPSVTQLVHPIVRRWDQHESKDYTMTGGAIVVEADKTYLLERGLQVRFNKNLAGANLPAIQYRSGDYWLIPARAATNDIEWPYHIGSSGGEPKKVYEFLEPHGVYQVFAPLAIAEPAGQDITVHPLQRKINQLWS